MRASRMGGSGMRRKWRANGVLTPTPLPRPAMRLQGSGEGIVCDHIVASKPLSDMRFPLRSGRIARERGRVMSRRRSSSVPTFYCPPTRRNPAAGPPPRHHEPPPQSSPEVLRHANHASFIAILAAVTAFAAPDKHPAQRGLHEMREPRPAGLLGTGAPEYATNFYGNYHTSPVSPVPGTQSLMLAQRGRAAELDRPVVPLPRHPAGRATTRWSVYSGPPRPTLRDAVDGSASKTVKVGPNGRSSSGPPSPAAVPGATRSASRSLRARSGSPRRCGEGAEPAEFALHRPTSPSRGRLKRGPPATRPVPAVTLALNQEMTLSPFGGPVQRQPGEDADAG